MTDAACETCPFWERLPERRDDPPGAARGSCHHIAAPGSDDPIRWADWWCSEHPLRQRDRLAAMAMQGLCASVAGRPDAHGIKMLTLDAYAIADAMLKEAVRARK